MRVKLTIAVVVLAAGCGLFDDKPRDRYALSSLSGQPLPVVLRSIRTVSGHEIDFIAVRGTLTLFSGGRFELEHDTHEVWDGEVRHVTEGEDRGSYERSDTEITIHFTDFQGVNQAFKYSILEGGRTLRGVQWEHEADYTRQ